MVLEWGGEVTKEGGTLPCSQRPPPPPPRDEGLGLWERAGRGQVLAVSSKQKMKG